MEGKEKGVERADKGNGMMSDKKLKRGMAIVGKRGGPSTPSPTWRLELFSSPEENSNHIREFLNNTTSVSARKLCANLWAVQPQLRPLSLSKTSKVPVGHNRRASFGHYRDKEAYEQHTHLAETSNIQTVRQPASASTSRRHAVLSVTRPHPLIEKSDRALQPPSPASYESSMEVAAYNHEVTPASSVGIKDGLGETSYSIKTSTELLKVLNRIWSLEEQQASNISLLKAMKAELDHSRSQIRKMLKEKETNRQEMDDLMKKVAEDKVVSNNKEQDRIEAATESLREEARNERKLRKHSESLHRKLARELSEVKYAFSNALKELERERKARILLENLCDEFAKGIRDYEQEVRSLRHRPEMVDIVGVEKPDRLLLHISEAWLDARMQMKLAETQNGKEKSTIVDKLGIDIETFLQARHSTGRRKDASLSTSYALCHCRRRESFQLNEAASAPQDGADEEDSIDGDSPCFELISKIDTRKQTIDSSKQRGDNAFAGHQMIAKSNTMKNTAEVGEHSIRNPAKTHMHFEEDKTQIPDSCETELRVDDQTVMIKSGAPERRGTYPTENFGFINSNYVLDNVERNHSLSSEGNKVHPECDLKEDACSQPAFMCPSPVQQWMPKLNSPEFDKPESSHRLTKSLKETTLKAKLLEARLEAQKSRLTASKASF